MSMFKEYGQEALPAINQLIEICQSVGDGKRLGLLCSLLEDAKEEIEQEVA